MASQQGITPNKDLALLVPSQSAGATRPTMSQKHNIKNLKVCAQCTNNKAVSNWSPLERLSTLAGQVAGLLCGGCGACFAAERSAAPLGATGGAGRNKADKSASCCCATTTLCCRPAVWLFLCVAEQPPSPDTENSGLAAVTQLVVQLSVRRVSRLGPARLTIPQPSGRLEGPPSPFLRETQSYERTNRSRLLLQKLE